jgi:hypothetical protein
LHRLFGINGEQFEEIVEQTKAIKKFLSSISGPYKLILIDMMLAFSSYITQKFMGYLFCY